MNKLTFSLLSFLIVSLMLFSGCSSLKKNNHHQITEHQNINERTKKLTKLSHWKINGKMAIMSPKERHSVTLNWHYQGNKNRQTLNLTTVLGFQVFNLESNNGLHIVQAEGKRYQSPDLNKLLSSLTGFTLPTQAMTYWLKGLPYLNNDEIAYNLETQLPKTLVSFYDEKKWSLKYGAYQQVGEYQLATKFTIKQEDLTLKLNVHQWDVKINDQ